MPSKQAQLVVGLALAAAVGIIGLSVAAPVVANNTGVQSVTNETVTAQSGEYVDLKGYDIDPGSETVYGYNDSSGSYETTTAYTLNESAGSIKFNTTSSIIEDGEEAKVSYDYQATGSLTSLVAGYLPLGMGLLVLVTVASRIEGLM